ncbi:hypothetical protein H4683_001055 [Filibacter limicola]|uniref:Uncharacterized protein n=1 Tax=Sporosarcina limicola TaxID=34101 RepID=A0A927RC42_9BACL|nr:hypothetical protein [Sporosarcina limicola]
MTTYNWSIVEIWHDDDLSINNKQEVSFEEFIVILFEGFKKMGFYKYYTLEVSYFGK